VYIDVTVIIFNRNKGGYLSQYNT